eukprot:TRINITY_DN9201_c0_g1_i1.p1 TRINITY_DN9201_c0_g1~~TRINITY_DN9201_c0_g1_i1.p1  ORF type:complete len:235 (+),score=39.11 TRINITY_DN9201_c0_g1_i1:45-749(+)
MNIVQENPRRSDNGKIANFVTKLWFIVHRKDFSPIVGWREDGVSFVIRDSDRFTEEVLPLYFKGKNFSSFVRQLNMYGFYKVEAKRSEICFANPLFAEGREADLTKIKRKSQKAKNQQEEEHTTTEVEQVDNSSAKEYNNLLRQQLEDLHARRAQQTDLESKIRSSLKQIEDNLHILRREIYVRDQKVKKSPENIDMLFRKDSQDLDMFFRSPLHFPDDCYHFDHPQKVMVVDF